MTKMSASRVEFDVERARGQREANGRARVKLSAAQTMVDTTVFLLPMVEDAAVAAGSRRTAEKARSVSGLMGAAAAQMAEMAENLLSAEAADWATLSDRFDAQERTLRSLQGMLEATKAERDSERGRADAAERALVGARADHVSELKKMIRDHELELDEAEIRINELEVERDSLLEEIEMLRDSGGEEHSEG